MKRCVFLLLCWLPFLGWAQDLEDWVEASADPDEAQAWLDELRRDPLDLNAASAEAIAGLPFLDKASAERLVSRRALMRGFESLDDALATESLNESQRNALRQLTVVLPLGSHQRVATAHIVGGLELASRTSSAGRRPWSRLQASFRDPNRRGYVSARRNSEDEPVFQRVSAGLELAIKQAGARLVLGDFQHETGTGLVFASSWGLAGWVSDPGSLAPKRARGFVLRSCQDRSTLMRGAGLTVDRGLLRATLIASIQRLDADLIEGEVERLTEGESPSVELGDARRDQLEERLTGFVLSGQGRQWTAGLAGYRSRFSLPFASGEMGEDPLAFSGDHVQVGSVFAGFSRGEMDAVSEVAWSRPGGAAHQSAISWRVNSTGLTAYHVFAAADFHSPHSRQWGGFGESAANVRETGVKTQCQWHAHTLMLRASTSQSPFRTSTSPLRNTAEAVEARWSWSVSVPVRVEMLCGRHRREETSLTEASRDVTVDRVRFETRIAGNDEFTIRFEARSARTEQTRENGTLLFLQAKAPVSVLEAFARLTFFALDGSEVAADVYENTLYGTYPLVSLQGTGRRAALMLCSRWKGLSGGLKVAHTLSESSGRSSETLECAVELAGHL